MRNALRRRRGHAVIVVICLIALIYFWAEGVGRRTRPSTRDALRCRLERQAIERGIAHWETKYGRLPADRLLWFDLDDRGTITYASAGLAEWSARSGVLPAQQLVEGSEVLPTVCGRHVDFGCPRYVGKTGFRPGQVYYRFVVDPRGIATPSSRWRTRGVLCLMHGESGPPDDPDAVHNFER